MRWRLSLRGHIEELDAHWQGEQLVLVFADGRRLLYERQSLTQERITLRKEGRTVDAPLAHSGREIHLHHGGRTLHVHRVDSADIEAEAAVGDPVLRAPMPGRILEILVQSGQAVESGLPLVRVEAMKMQVDLVAPVSGTIQTVHVGVGDLVEPEAALITIQVQPA